VHGRFVRRSLDLRNWEAANRLAREWEVNGPENTVSMRDAISRYLKDAEARKLKEGSLRKYRQSVKDLEMFGSRPLRSITVEDLRLVRESWAISGTTMLKRLEMIKAFFRFCVDSGWLQSNPAKAIKPPVVKRSATLPFSDDEFKKILDAVEEYPQRHPQSPPEAKKKLRAFIVLMRYSGLRISDACTLRKDRVKDGKLFVYPHKTTDIPVWMPLPKLVLHALAECESRSEFYFYTGNGKVKTWTTEWEERFKKVCVIAGLPKGHSHMLRDSFAVDLLSKGVPLETVAVLLGNSLKVAERHYAPWVKSRQISLEAAVAKIW